MSQVYTFESGAFLSHGHNSISLPVSGLVQILVLLTYSAISGLNTSQYSTSSADAESWPLLYLMQHLPHELHSLIITFLFLEYMNNYTDKHTPYLLSDFYAAAPSLRVSIKQQCFCLDKSRLISLFEMTNRTYALRGTFSLITSGSVQRLYLNYSINLVQTDTKSYITWFVQRRSRSAS